MGLQPITRPTQTHPLDSAPQLLKLYGKAVAPNLAAPARKIGKLLPFGSAQPTVDASANELPDVSYTLSNENVDAAKLREYQQLFGYPDNGTVPAGFAHITAFPVAMALMVSSDFPLDLLGMVHLSNRIEAARPLLTNETFDVIAWAQNLSGHAKGTSVELVAEIHVGNEIVWRGTSTYLAKGKYLRGRGATAPERQEFEAPFPTGRWQLNAGIGRTYAGVSGDVNPIHLSALSAKALGFPRAIAHGMYTASLAFAQALPLVPDAYVWNIEFAKPVLLPGTVSVAITGSRESGVEFLGWNGKSSKLHFTGSITALEG